VQRFERALPGVAVVASRSAPGLSGAKNTGIETASGDIIAFLDDDAVAEPDWLKFLADSYSGPAVAGFGGRTLPRWQTSRPAWLPAEFDWVLGCSDLGMPEGTAPVRNVMGGKATRPLRPLTSCPRPAGQAAPCRCRAAPRTG
jgi:glycosyltransferase involved in cell wall biosynthesis